MNIRCVAKDCDQLSNKLYVAPVYDPTYTVYLCDKHKDTFNMMDTIANIVQEDGLTKVICYNCHFKWVPLTLEYKNKDRVWSSGSMAGKKYGDLPHRCSECRSMYWNSPHISRAEIRRLGREKMEMFKVNQP